MSHALASVTGRLCADFQSDLSMAEIQTTGRQCRHDLDTAADPAHPEPLERLARQRHTTGTRRARRPPGGKYAQRHSHAGLPREPSDGTTGKGP